MKLESVIDSVGREFGEDLVDELLRAGRRAFGRAVQTVRRPQAALGVVKSPLGNLLVAATARGIVCNHYLRDAADLSASIADLRLHFDLVDDRRTAEQIGEEVRLYLDGNAGALRHKADLALAESSFQKKVLERLCAVPRGAVISYGGLGAAAGAAKAARAVGNALHNNPVPIYVPCHRVIASSGLIGGYGGGLARKVKLLRAEGFAIYDPAARISDTAVWGDRRSRIFCKPDCSTLRRAEPAQMMFFAGPEQARKAGMHPCRVCRPDSQIVRGGRTPPPP